MIIYRLLFLYVLFLIVALVFPGRPATCPSLLREVGNLSHETIFALRLCLVGMQELHPVILGVFLSTRLRVSPFFPRRFTPGGVCLSFGCLLAPRVSLLTISLVACGTLSVLSACSFRSPIRF